MVKSPLGDLGVNIHANHLISLILVQTITFIFFSTYFYLDAKVTKDQDCSNFPKIKLKILQVQKLTSFKQFKLA